MIFTLGLQIRVMRFFWGFKVPQKNVFAVNTYACAPAFTCDMPRNPKKTMFISYVRPFLVLHVLCNSHISKIVKRVVQRVSVNVVNYLFRMRARHIKPRQTVSFIRTTFKSNCAVTCITDRSSHTIHPNATIRFYPPGKHAGFRIIGKHCSYVFRSYVSHRFERLCSKVLAYHENLIMDKLCVRQS